MKAILLFLPFVAACSSSYMREAQPGGPPGEGESKVVFCRPSRFAGSAVTFDVWDGSTLIGFAESGTYFEYRCTPGKHLFLAEGESDKAIDADLAPRKTYYVWVTPRMGFMTANVGFTPVTKDSELVPKLEKALMKNKCRELIPEKWTEYQDRHREQMEKLKAQWSGASQEKALKLVPEDGQ